MISNNKGGVGSGPRRGSTPERAPENVQVGPKPTRIGPSRPISSGIPTRVLFPNGRNNDGTPKKVKV